MPDPCAPARRQPLNSLSTKIIFFGFLSTFLTALAVSWISIESTYRFLERRIDETFPALLEGSAERVGGWLDAHLAGTVSAAAALAAAPPGDAPEAQEALVRAAGELGGASGAWLLAADGRVLAAAPSPTRPPPGLAVPESAQPAGPALVAARLPNGSPVLAAIAPVPAQDGRAAAPALLVAAFDPASLGPLLAGGPGSDGRRVHLVAADGLAMASSDPEQIGERIALPPGPEPVSDYAGSDGERRVGATRPLPHAGLTLVVEEPFDRAFEPVLSVVTRIFVTDLAIIFLFSFLAYQITAAIVKPIEALSEGARRVSQGELDVEIPDTRGGDEIALLTRTFNDMMRKLRKNQLEIESANQQLKDQNQALQRANEVLAQLSITDGLTRLHNHRFFQDHLTREIKRVQRSGEPLSMLLIDIDDFKRLNDRLGHAAGDELLARIARTMNEAMRESDLLARYGGEEFVVLASNTELRGAATLAEKVRAAVAESTFLLDDSNRLERVTVSIGVAQFKGDRKGFFQGADRALYRAKGAGKNCVRIDDGSAA